MRFARCCMVALAAFVPAISLAGQTCSAPVPGDPVRVSTKKAAGPDRSLVPVVLEGSLLHLDADSVWVGTADGVQGARTAWAETTVHRLCLRTTTPGWDGAKIGLLAGVPVGLLGGYLWEKKKSDPTSQTRSYLTGAAAGGLLFTLAGAATGKLMGPFRWVEVEADPSGPSPDATGLTVHLYFE